jgi:SAM-dependent methyltransferase
MAIDTDKLNAFLGKAVGDMGAGFAAAHTLLGDRLGLYKAMADGKPVTPAELAKRTGTVERYVSEWLNGQASGGYVTYDAKKKTFTLPPEQAFCLADETSPAFLPGAFQVLFAAWQAEPRLEKCFKTGEGIDWGEHHPCLFEGTERFFRSSYIGNLVSAWLPALDGVEAKLKKGAKVADVGCGHGASTILMAQAYPKSKFFGFDSHAPSIEACRARAKQAGVAGNTTFEVASAQAFPGTGYDLVAHFDCVHDMADPVGAAKQTKKALATDGTWRMVEPVASDKPEENHNPVGRVYYGASTMICVPVSLAGKGPALGAQAGETRLKDIATKGGFTRFRRATTTPFNMILEARP